jgi:hypothetical protein
VSRYPWGDVNAYNAFLDEEERHLWEEKVRFALYGENARVRADVELKREKEEGPAPSFTTETIDGPATWTPHPSLEVTYDDLADHEGLD